MEGEFDFDPEMIQELADLSEDGFLPGHARRHGEAF